MVIHDVLIGNALSVLLQVETIDVVEGCFDLRIPVQPFMNVHVLLSGAYTTMNKKGSCPSWFMSRRALTFTGSSR